MVESIGARPATAGDLQVAPVARAAAAAVTTQPDSTGIAQQTGTAPTLASQLAASAPVDNDRVARIKAAIAHGTFPIAPAKIADQLIALKYEWMASDKA